MRNQRRSQNVRLKYTFIKAHRSEFDIAVMCRLLDVSRSGFYEWLRKPLSDRAVEDQWLLGMISAAYLASHGVYGAPRIFLDLREAGETCSKHQVARIMRANYLKVLYKRRNEIERLFRRLKRFRRLFSRFGKLDVMFIAFINFTLIVDGFR